MTLANEEPDQVTGAEETADLDRIEADLAGVERALERLDAGTYWTCEATGSALPDDALAADPTITSQPVPATAPAPGG